MSDKAIEAKEHDRIDECCPVLEDVQACDVLDFRYRLPFRPRLPGALAQQQVRVEVVLHFRLERCPGPLTRGDLAYTTTLLPGEQVRLFTSDRRSRFTYDSTNKLAYRHQAMSTESYYMAGMAQAMSSLNVVDQSKSTSDYSESSFGGGAGGGFSLFGLIEFGGSVSGSSFDSQSVSTFVRSLSQHAASSSRHVETGTHAANAVSIGEVESRTHTETESQEHFESASRTFKNPNQCHALTFYFFRINKSQTIRFKLVSIERHVIDPAAPTNVGLLPPPATGGVSVAPASILATAADRLEVEQRAKVSVAQSAVSAVDTSLLARAALLQPNLAVEAAAISARVRQAALAAVDKELVAAGLLDPQTGEVTQEAQTRFGWERTITLPTPGIMVKGCLDECDVCEPALDKAIQLDLERKRLENELLKKKIELLEKSQEYRCCPAGEEESAGVSTEA